MNFHERGTITLPTLEDANSIQVGLAEVMRLLVTNQIDHRTAALMLYALQTASGGWATLTGKYNAGLSLNMDRNNWGCATSRAFREVAR
jgi:hypothetical protein